MPASAIHPAAIPGLSPQQVARFDEQGFLHVPAVIAPDELVSLRQAADQLIAGAQQAPGPASDRLWQEHPRSGQPVLARINHLQAQVPAFTRLWGHPRLLAIAEAVQGHDVLPLAMAMVVKTPGFGVIVPWHRDPAFCTVRWGTNLGIYLDDADAENGMLRAIPRSHRQRRDDLADALARHDFDLDGSVAVPVRAGDLILHNENVLHGSPQVASQRPRRVIYFGVRCIPEQLSSRGLDRQWVGGYARLLLHAISLRQAALGAAEAPFRWRPSDASYLQAPPPGAAVELRLPGGDGHGDPSQCLPFADDPPRAAGL